MQVRQADRISLLQLFARVRTRLPISFVHDAAFIVARRLLPGGTAIRRPALLLVAVLPLVLRAGLAAAATSGLPDTGQTLCDNGSHVLAACSSANTGDAAAYPRQDGRFGRDAAAATGALRKVGGGAAGFDYTKVANNKTDLGPGAALGGNPGDWACTRDNVTLLTWEVKTFGGADLRYRAHTYTWYNSTGVNDGGNAGSLGSNTCNGTLSAYSNQCNTQNFVAAVNAAALCGYADWRLPTLRELLTLVHAGALNTAIDLPYFPDALLGIPYLFWSGTPYASNSAYAWIVNFFDGSSASSFPGFIGASKTAGNPVRLVRGAQF